MPAAGSNGSASEAEIHPGLNKYQREPRTALKSLYSDKSVHHCSCILIGCLKKTPPPTPLQLVESVFTGDWTGWRMKLQENRTKQLFLLDYNALFEFWRETLHFSTNRQTSTEDGRSLFSIRFHLVHFPELCSVCV